MFPTKFIAATTAYSDYAFESHVPAPYLRKTLMVEQGIKSATLTICGLGFYELFLNGNRITKGALAPYISNPDDVLYYDQYDVTRGLQQGKNALGILLGNGMLNCPGGSVWSFQNVRYRSAPKVALELLIEYENGEQQTVSADTSFKTHPSPILFDDLRCGEIYDANKEVAGWNLPDFDDSNWQNAIEAETPRGEATLCTAEPIVVHKQLQPVKITPNVGLRFPKGLHGHIGNEVNILLPDAYKNGYLYDFGQNLAGVPTLKIKGQAGQTIFIQTGEALDAEGNLDLRCFSFQPNALDHCIYYTLKGGEEEIYTPTFTYYGMRYCLVCGITSEQATDDLLTYNVMGSALSKNGDFTCSSDVVNRLQQTTVNANNSNFYYFPTDCPHREKNGWTADAALSAEQMLFNLTPENSWRVWLQNIRKAQRIDGALPGIVPTGGWGFTWGNGPAWDSVLFYLPYYTWQYRGNTEIIRENATAMMRYLNYIANRRDEKGLLHIGLGDWCHIGYCLPMAPLEVTDTLTTMQLCQMAAKMFTAVDMPLQEKFALNLFEELRTAAREHLVLHDGITLVGTTQTGQAMGIAFGLFGGGEKQAAFEVLLDLIHHCGDRLDAGVLGGRLIFHVLSDFGYADLAYKMITRTDNPSYGSWVVNEGATALFEDFRHIGSAPASQNHHFWGDISSWFFKTLCGVKINPFARDIHEVEISPGFIADLTHASGWQNHVGGKIEAKWHREENGICLTVHIPEGCYGYLRLPKGYGFKMKPTDHNCQNFRKLNVGTTAYFIEEYSAQKPLW